MSATAPILTGKLRLKDETGGTLRSLGSSFKSTFTSIGRIAAGVLARDVVRGLISVVKEAITLGGTLETVQAGFNALTNNIGAGTLSLDTLREAVSGAVPDVDLLKTANNALALGLPIDKLNALFSAAQTVGNVMGRSTLDAVNDLATGIGRQSRLILDNLGIIVDVDAAYETYAKTLGKSANGLTDNERKTAFMNFAIKALTQRANQLEGTTSELQIAQEALSASWTNMVSQIGKALIPMFVDIGTGMLDLMGTIKEVITKISEGDWAGAWGIIQTTFEEAWNGLNEWINSNVDWNQITDNINDIGVSIKAEFDAIPWDTIWTNITTWWDNIKWLDLWHGLIDILDSIWDDVIFPGLQAIGDITTGFLNWFAGVRWFDVFAGMKEGMGLFWMSFKNAVGDLTTLFIEWFKGIRWFDVFASMVSFSISFTDFITEAIFDAIRSIGAGVGEAILKQIFGDFLGGIISEYSFNGAAQPKDTGYVIGEASPSTRPPPTGGGGFTSTIIVEVMAGGNNDINSEAANMISTRLLDELMRRGVIP